MNIQEFWKAARAGEINFYWVNLNDDRVCPDCMAIALQQKREGYSWNEWVQFGLPRSGHTVCDKHCRCRVAPLMYVQTNVVVPPNTYEVTQVEKRNLIVKYGNAPSPRQEKIIAMVETWERAGLDTTRLVLIGKTETQMEEYLTAMLKQNDLPIPGAEAA